MVDVKGILTERVPAANMDLRISAGDGSKLEFSLGLPPALQHLAIPEVPSVYAVAPFGKMIFHELKGGGFTIVYSHYICDKDVTLDAHLGQPVLEFQMALRNTARFSRAGLGEVLIGERQFNLFYTPFWETSCTLSAGESYTTLVIIFDVPFLERLVPDFPFLDEFLDKVRQGQSARLTETAVRAGKQMMGITQNIFFGEFMSHLRNLYVEAKVLELLILAMDTVRKSNGGPAARTTLKPYDMDRIKAAAAILKEHMDEPITIVELARRVGLNDYKLKNGFRQLYGSTVFNYFMSVRMEKAKTLLGETNLPISDIAFMTGYRNVSNFTTAFRKNFGVAPGSLRKRSEGGIKGT